MGKIEKIIKKGPVEGQTAEVYPVTSTKAVYDENNKRLDNIITGLQESVYLNTPILISTDNTPESIAQNVKNISDYIEKAKAAGIADVNGIGVTCLIDDYFSGVGYIFGNTNVSIQGIKIPDDIVNNAVFTIVNGRYDERFIVGVDELDKVTSNMLVQGARKPIILTPDTTEVDEETYQKLLKDNVDVLLKDASGNVYRLTTKNEDGTTLYLYFTCITLQGTPAQDIHIFGFNATITKNSPHTCSIDANFDDSITGYLDDAGYLNKSTLSPILQEINNSLGGKQDKTDNTLSTTDKTVSGAINEINTKVGNLTGALTWKGKFDTLPAVTDYEAGNVIGVGNKEYVLTVTGSTKAWEELGDEGSYLLKSVAEETYAKKTSIPTVNNPKVSIKMNGAEKGSFTLNQASAGEVDLGTVITAHQDISGKQDKLISGTNIKTINGESVLGSGDITISSAYPEVNHGTGDTTFTLTPNTFHVWDEVTSLTLNFGNETDGVANEYLFQFTSGSTATSLTLPNDIKWANDNVPTIEANMIYQVSILHGLASVLKFNNNIDYTKEPLTFNILSAGTINWTASDASIAKTIDYKLNNGEWVSITSNTGSSAPTIEVNSGDKIQFRGNNAQCGGNDRWTILYNSFGSSASFEIEGNIMSLIYGDDFKNNSTISSGYTFVELFSKCVNLVSAENLVLPATTLADYCYYGMFQNCTSLTTAPKLPATTLANYCYQFMFDGCTSLTKAPELPATTLTSYCYQEMFLDCTSLTTAPALPATTLAGYCYQSMFLGCTSLTTAPVLPATILENSCYSNMFKGCTLLTTAPELPATTLAENCYNCMFRDCTSLTTVPSALPSTNMWRNCYYGMFQNCTSLTTAPELPATTSLNRYCYQAMFMGCTSLNYIKCLATDISATNCTQGWVSGVASTGTFVKNPNMTSWTTGVDGIPSGWTVQDA